MWQPYSQRILTLTTEGGYLIHVPEAGQATIQGKIRVPVKGKRSMCAWGRCSGSENTLNLAVSGGGEISVQQVARVVEKVTSKQRVLSASAPKDSSEQVAVLCFSD